MMNNDQLNNTNPDELPSEKLSEESEDRISIVQWILLFVTLGLVTYFTPVLLSFLPK